MRCIFQVALPKEQSVMNSRSGTRLNQRKDFIMVEVEVLKSSARSMGFVTCSSSEPSAFHEVSFAPRPFASLRQAVILLTCLRVKL